MTSKPKQSEDIKLGYLVISTQKNGSYLGGIMVVDRRGLPLEFHYTEKVSPTSIQKILYGGVLSQFIKENLISENLYSALKNKPDLLICGERELEINSPAFDLPVIYLERSKAEPLEPGNGVQELSEDAVLFQAASHERPLVLRFLKVAQAVRSDIIDILNAASEHLDLIEPINRITEALSEVEKELGSKKDES